MKITLGQAYSFCQIGKRDNQEDSRYPDVDVAGNLQRFYVVCDGVGGCEKGELASHIVCSSFASSLEGFDFTKDFSNTLFRRALDKAYDAIDKQSKGSAKDMATTLTFVCFHGEGCTIAHIGDSRVYLIRPDEGILYRTDDHSLVNSMVHNGVITPEEVKEHPQQHIITRCMESVASDESRCQATVIRWRDLKAGDCVFLCTDGVLHCLTDEELVEIISNPLLSSEEKTESISDRCKNSPDNNTAWYIPIEAVEGGESFPSDSEALTSQTKRIGYRRSGTEEIESVRPSSHGNIKKWFKSLIKFD